MNRIHMFCGQIQTAGGFEYKLPSDILKQTLNGDCEQSWYSKDGHLLADPSDPHTLSDPVISVSSDRLITSHCVDQLHHEIECDIDGSYYSHQTRFRAFSFEKNIADISVSCGEIQTDEGFEYRLQSNLLNQTVNGDCDQSWYLEDGRVLADPSDPHKLMYPVTSVSSDRLVTSDCVNLNHEIICHSNNLRFEIMFRVFNDTDSSGGPTQTPDSYQFWWISALFFIMILAFLCFLLRKRIFRYFLKAEKSNFQLSDSEIRDPEPAVQKKLRSDESDSLNHTESEQINGSCPEDHPVITLNIIH